MKSTKADEVFFRAIRAYWRRQGLPAGVKVLAAVSGGPDSTALVVGLGALRGELGFSLALAHYEHGLRSEEEAAREIAFVEGLGIRLGLEVVVERAEPGGLKRAAEREKKSLEDVARTYRHRFLRRTAERLACAYIALGHTAEDRRETQVMRFFQGAPPEGLAGIPARRGALIRPLSELEKADILGFLSLRGQEYCVDRSNADPVFLRNHLRARLLPAVGDVFPGYKPALDRLAVKSRLLRDYVETALDRENPWKREGDDYICAFDDFLALHPLLRIMSIYRLFDAGGAARGDKRLPFGFLAPLVGLKKDKSRGVVLRGRGMRLELKDGLLYWKSDIVLDRKKGYLYVVEEALRIDVSGRLRIEVDEVPSAPDYEDDVFSCEKSEPLILRSRRPGDSIQTEGGNKTLKKLFSEARIPESFRDVVPVLQSGKEIVGVLTQPFGIKTIRTPESVTWEQGDRKNFRFRVFKIGEERG